VAVWRLRQLACSTVGHARTFWVAAQRAAACGGTLILRNEDLDPQRSRTEFVEAMVEDLHWLGIRWNEGPDCGGPFAPYSQSERREHYLSAWRRLRDGGSSLRMTRVILPAV
jgi:glutamyl/glutaminyl-tRNA synthetase